MIVIPMVGKSSRFFKAGYNLPKYQLQIAGVTMFAWSVSSFEKYFKTDLFIFLVRSDYDAPKFVKQQIDELGITRYKIITFDTDTLGQADTVYQGLKEIESDEELYIFNIDSRIRGFKKPKFEGRCDGYLEVFIGEGNHWSFIEPGGNQNVLRTTEKERISSYCSDGLYFFKNLSTFCETFLYARDSGETTKGEYYIAPLYNYLISQGRTIKYVVIDSEDLEICGTPEEYLQMGGGKA